MCQIISKTTPHGADLGDVHGLGGYIDQEFNLHRNRRIVDLIEINTFDSETFQSVRLKFR